MIDLVLGNQEKKLVFESKIDCDFDGMPNVPREYEGQNCRKDPGPTLEGYALLSVIRTLSCSKDPTGYHNGRLKSKHFRHPQPVSKLDRKKSMRRKRGTSPKGVLDYSIST